MQRIKNHERLHLLRITSYNVCYTKLLRRQGKAEVLDNLCTRSAEEVVSSEADDVSDEFVPSVSLAFMKACLASPSEVKFCKIHVPSNYREARRSEYWELWEGAMNRNNFV